MKGRKIKNLALVVFVASVSILLGIGVYKIQTWQLLPVEPSLIQTPSAPSTIPPSPTFPTPSATTLENLFGTSSCLLPCWQGITPGVTPGTEALQRIKDSALVLKNSVQAEGHKTGFGIAHWYWKIGDNQPVVAGNMEWRDGIVHSIDLGAYPIISIGQIINRFNPPEKIEVMDCTEVVEGPQWWCATLYYEKNGFEIHISWERTENGNGVQITPADPISFVLLSEPSTIEEWLSSLGRDPQQRDLQDWKGFGDLLDLYVR